MINRNRHFNRGRLALPSPAVRAAQPAPQTRWVHDGGYVILITALIWLIFYQNLPSNLSGYAGVGEGAAFGAANQLDRFIKLFMIAVSSYLIVVRWQLVRNLLKVMNPGLLGFFVLAPVSVLWSISPGDTVLRFISLAAMLLVCFACTLVSWHPRRFQQVLLPPVMLIFLASLAIGAVEPNWVIEYGDDIALKNSWHGVTHGKNEFGMLSGFGVLLCAHGWFSREGRTGWYMAGTAIAFLCLSLSRSNTSMFATVLALVCMFLLIRSKIVARSFTATLAYGVSILILVYEMIIQGLIPGVDVLLAPIMGLTGKDTTFSARTTIWMVVKQHIALSPYIGSGFGAYWIGALPESPSYIFLSIMYLYPTESHNGYLEVVNDLGYLGLGVVLVFLYFYVRQSLQLMRTDRSQGALFLALLFLEMVVNMSESDWFSRSNTFTMLALASVCLSRGLFDAKLRGEYETEPQGRVALSR
jgi:exopolysaccharide production protein ExoQ